MQRVQGILETAIYVADLQRAADFYRRVFSFPTLLQSERLIALDVAGNSVLLLFLAGATGEPNVTPGGVIPPHRGAVQGHLAFSISADDVEPWQERLASEGIEVESTVHWPGDARSLYFRDPDQTLVELITPGFWSIY